MATLRDIKTSIKSVQSTEKITNAMKMVAAAKLRRAQENIINARPYARKIAAMVSDLVTENDIQNNPLLQEKDTRKIAIVAVTADRGLCGAFNSNIIKEVHNYIIEQQEKNVESHLLCIGKKGYEFFSKRDFNLINNYSGIFSQLKYGYAQKISEELIDLYLNKGFDKVYVVYNEFKSIIQQRIVVEQFLPIPVQNTSNKNAKIPDFIYEPDQNKILEYLLPKHLKAQLWRILLESNASELGAKMTAMDNATTNAKELIRTLNLKYNRERQAAITKELIEIVSGANALK